MTDTAGNETSFHDRYRDVGLQNNPFTAPQLGKPACSAFVNRGIAEPPAPWSRTLVQVIGHSGYGKSSQLQHWRASAPGAYHYIPRQPYRDRWQTPPAPQQSDGVIYGDEIDRMPAPLRRSWFRRLAAQELTLIIGTHIDLARHGERAGFDVVTHRLEPFDRDTLATAIELRLHAVALRDNLPELFSADDIDRVFSESGGNPEEADVICHRLLAQLVR